MLTGIQLTGTRFPSHAPLGGVPHRVRNEFTGRLTLAQRKFAGNGNYMPKHVLAICTVGVARGEVPNLTATCLGVEVSATLGA
jgi:hypothetical protein